MKTRLFKLKSLFIGLALLLCSCGNSSVAGTYGFQMGKTSSTHIGAFLILESNLNPTISPDKKPFCFKIEINEPNNEEGYSKLNIGFNGTYDVGEEQKIIFTIISVEGNVIDEESRKTISDAANFLISAYSRDGKISITVPVSLRDIILMIEWNSKKHDPSEVPPYHLLTIDLSRIY